MDGDVSRKEKITHCGCKSTACEHKGKYMPLECDKKKEIREICPILLPCTDHEKFASAYMRHLEGLIGGWLQDLSDVCIVIPCDSTEAWIVAAYDEMENIENIADPWINIISKKKTYHNIRISGTQKRQKTFREFSRVVCSNWKRVTELCLSAKKFEENIISLNEDRDRKGYSV